MRKSRYNPLNSVLFKLIRSFTYQLEKVLPSEFAETRVMSSDNSPNPGKFSYDWTPYLKDIIDLLDPRSPVKTIVVMKGAQLGFSSGVLTPFIGWVMKYNPGNIIMSVGNSNLIGKAMEGIDQMIDSTGIRNLIGATTKRKTKQQTGDTNTGKIFVGGSLFLFSATNNNMIRQINGPVGLYDDLEAIPGVSKKDGSVLKILEQRHAAFGDKKKMLLISTPQVKQTSNIWPAYLMGDQRKRFVPCPCCTEFITIEWEVLKDGRKIGGIVWQTDEDDYVIDDSIKYQCQECGDKFSERHKQKMNLAGEWRPTARAKRKDYVSFHISALYAPLGMDGWAKYVDDYREANPKGQPQIEHLMQAFTNVVLGLPWEERRKNIDASRLAMNTRDYDIGVVPDVLSVEDGNGEIVLITCGCDLNGTEKDARLDYEVVAWSESGASYSVTHGSIGTFIPRESSYKVKKKRAHWSYYHGVQNSVWDEFLNVLNKQYPTQSGGFVTISISGVDTGYHDKFAWQFINNYNPIGPCFGVKGNVVGKDRKITADSKSFKRSTEINKLFLLEVNQVKDDVFSRVELNWSESDGIRQPNGFMNFPTPSEGKYLHKNFFSHFAAEHRIIVKNNLGVEIAGRWEKKNSTVQNHLLDCHVYNAGMKDIMCYNACLESGIKNGTWAHFCEIVKS